jgi:hypothetical protein
VFCEETNNNIGNDRLGRNAGDRLGNGFDGARRRR